MASLGLGYYGSWLNIVSTISTDQQNLNLWTYVNNIASNNYGWNRNGGKKLRAIITINSGVNIYSENPLTPAITIPADSANTFRSYDQVIIINNGNIYGAGGTIGSGGGSVAGTTGGKGGTALYTRKNIILTNNGRIYGGGGGGGGGGGAFVTSVTTGSTNCGDAQYCNACCILNCKGRNFCSTPNDCTLGAACFSYCEYYTNGENCNGSTVGTCNWKNRSCTTYIGGNGGRGQGYNKNFASGVDGVFYSAQTFTGDGGDGGNWGENGSNGAAGSTTSFGNGGEAGCWIDGFELLILQKSNDEKGLGCISSGGQVTNALWSGWSQTPSITTDPVDGSGVTLTTEGTDLKIEPRNILTSLIVNNPTDLGGQMNLSNCSLLETLTCDNQNITSLNLTNCNKLKTINFSDNNLTSLNASSCTILRNLYLDNNNLGGNLTGLDGMGTSVDETRVISVKNNNMSAQNLNDLFDRLPSRNLQFGSEWSIYIDDNPGVCTSDWNKAKNKGWRVYPNQYSLTSTAANVDEGMSVSFDVDTTTFGSDNIPYTVSGTGITTADISGDNLTGNFSLYKGGGRKTFNISNDSLLEGNETMTLSIDSATCPTSRTITIIDNSIFLSTTISSNVNNYNNVNAFLTANGWNGTDVVSLTINIPAGVTVGSTASNNPALTIPALPAGSLVTINNNGNIYGAGGSGGTGTTGVGNTGGDGGTAISTRTRLVVNNQGNIKGGGGGGGGGGGYSDLINICTWGRCSSVEDCCSHRGLGSVCACAGGCGSGNTCPTAGTPCSSGEGYCYCSRSCVTVRDGSCVKWCRQTTRATCDCINSGANYNGGNAGNGEGSGTVVGNGAAGSSGTIGGNGGLLGFDGLGGGNYSASATGGPGGLAGYYLKTESGATYTITPNLGGTEAGRIA
jgi:hypothetical protein